jgi:hypothetical protein
VKAWLKYVQPIVLAAAVAALVAACDETLEGGAACPALCPTPSTSVRDTTLFAVEMDTSVVGFPTMGSELQLFIASFGDTLETRAVVRFDTLPTTCRHNNSAVDSTIVFIDTGAVLKLRLAVSDTLGLPTTVEAYDVNLGGPDDIDPTAAASAFTVDRLLGSATFPAAALKDSISIPIDPAKLLAKIQSDTPASRLRIGIKVATNGGKLTLVSTNAGSPPLLIFRPGPDTSVSLVTVVPRSLTPAEDVIKLDLADYLLVTKSPLPPAAGAVRVGGMPGRRAYLRFNIPTNLLDSSNVIRATLLLTQRPNPLSARPGDSVAVIPLIVTAGPAITDLSRALLFLTPPPRPDSVRVVPTDSGAREFEMISALRLFWRNTTADRTPRAIALRTSSEGLAGGALDFFSIEAPIDVRPKLRITYLLPQQGGLP